MNSDPPCSYARSLWKNSASACGHPVSLLGPWCLHLQKGAALGCPRMPCSPLSAGAPSRALPSRALAAVKELQTPAHFQSASKVACIDSSIGKGHRVWQHTHILNIFSANCGVRCPAGWWAQALLPAPPLPSCVAACCLPHLSRPQLPHLKRQPQQQLTLAAPGWGALFLWEHRVPRGPGSRGARAFWSHLRADLPLIIFLYFSKSRH